MFFRCVNGKCELTSVNLVHNWIEPCQKIIFQLNFHFKCAIRRIDERFGILMLGALPNTVKIPVNGYKILLTELLRRL